MLGLMAVARADLFLCIWENKFHFARAGEFAKTVSLRNQKDCPTFIFATSLFSVDCF